MKMKNRNKPASLLSSAIAIIILLVLALSGQAAFAAGDVAPVTFHDNPDPVAALGIVNYAIDVHNNHEDDAAVNPTLELTVPAGFSFASVNDAIHCSYTGTDPSDGTGTVDCSWTSLAPDTSYNIDVELRASAIAATYTLTATATSVGDGNTANDSEINNTDVIQGADLVLANKSSVPEDTVFAGGILTYKFEVRNDGPYNASNLVVNDQLPAGLEFFADNADPAADNDGDWACTASGQDVSCTSSSLADGATTFFYFRVKVTTDTTGDITNSASVTSDTPEPDPDNNTDTDDIEILAGTDMSIAKTVDTDPVIGGQPAQFTVTATNEGPMTASNVSVSDTLPSGYTDIAVTAPAGWNCDDPVVGTQLTCTNPSMPAGQSAAIVITATPPAVTDVVTHQNSATVSTDTTDPIPGNDTATVAFNVNPDIADLSISKSKSPSPVAQGSDATSTITVVNNGPREADPVQVVDVLSPNETYVVPDPVDPNWTCTHSGPNPGGTVTCDYNNSPLATGSQAEILTITTTATNAGILTNTACTGGQGGSVEPGWGDTLTGNNCSDGSVTSTSEQADLVVTKVTDDDSIDTTENSFTYTITVHNNGLDTSESVDFTDTIPQFVSAGTGGRPATLIVAVPSQGTCTVTNALVECALGNIAYTGDTTSDVTVAITVTRPMRDGTRTNTASAYSTLTGDPDRSNNSDDAVVTVDPVTDIEVTTKNVTYSNHPDPILAGTIATYTIQVRNNGPSLAQTVQLADVFTGQPFTFISSHVAGSGSCTFDTPSRTLNCNLNNMNANTTKSITVEIRPNHLLTVPDPWEIYNTATVSMATADSILTNNSQSLTLPIQVGQTDLAVEKNESPDFTEPVRFNPAAAGTGNHLVYEVIVSNRGPSLATGVTFVDNVTSVSPSNGQQLQFIRDTENSDGSVGTFPLCSAPTPNPFPVDGTPQNITCELVDPVNNPLGELASGASLTRYLVFEVVDTPNSITGDVYLDEVVVSGNEVETSAGNNIEDENTTVRTVVDLEIEKTGPAGQVEVKEHFNLTLTVTNHGPGDSPQTTVVDNLPSGMVLTGNPNSTTPGVSVTCTGSAGATSFDCDIDSDPDPIIDVMTSGITAVITIPVKLTNYPPGGSITNTASVSGLAPEPNPDPHPNTDDHTVTVHPQAILGNFVWLDRDADGIQGAGEPGISGVTVNLRNSGGGLVDTTTTNGSGIYSFTINHAANYIVEFIRPTRYFYSPQDEGGNDNTDSDASVANGKTGQITIDYGDNNQTVDAGMYQTLSLGDTVWLDDNANGMLDPGEHGIAGIIIDLWDITTSAEIVTTTTDNNGEYLFTDLNPGDYLVRITLPTWMKLMPTPVQNSNPNDNANNDSNIEGFVTANVYFSGTITLASGTEPTNDGDTDNNTNLSLDFGLVLPGSIGNYIWLDENSDGIQDAGEPGVANVTVQLKDSDGNVIATTVTDSNGGYLFTDLPPGDYFVEVDDTTLPTGMSQTTIYPDPGSDFANQDQSMGHGYAVHLISGGENLTADFGYNWPTGALGDRIWIDNDGDGVQDAGEPGVSGAVVTLYSAGPDGLFGTVDDVEEATTNTDAAGNYIFDNLDAGAYAVEVTDSAAANYDILSTADYAQTGDPDHFAADSSTAPAGTAGDNRSTLPIIIAPGDTFVNADFGYQPEAATPVYDIGDTVWIDADRDGVIDAGENGIFGVIIGLQDASGAFIATTTTDADGKYLFTDLPDGDYTVVVIDSNNVLAGLNPTYDHDNGIINPDEQSVLTLAGSDDLDQDFGYAPKSPNTGTGMIGDTIFLDHNGNGIPEPGEGIEGVRVVLRDTGSGDIIAVTFTDENGNYLFGGLPAGNYTIVVDTGTLPPGVTNSVDPEGAIDSTSHLSLGGGEINLDQDFGYVADTPGSIGNLIWKDSNADGVYQPNGLDGVAGTADDETPFVGVTLDLYLDSNQDGQIDPGEPKIGSTVTDANGNYLFDGLPAGSYNVKVTDTADVLAGFWHSRGTDDTDNNSQVDYYSVNLPGGGSVLTADFGYYVQPGSVGDRVWKDEDGNGLFDPATDTPLADVSVFLDIVYPDGTTVTLQTLTDADGLYRFPNLLQDEDYNGIGTNYGNGGDEPSHTIRIDAATIPIDLVEIYATRGSNTDTTTVGGAASDEDDLDMGSDDPAGEPGYPPMGSIDTTNDFGFFEPGSIGDTVWNDMNNDGIVDAGEGLAGVTVTLTPPADVDLGNGLGAPVTTVTNGDGEYLFSDLPPGHYTVTVDEATLPPVLQGANTVDPDGGNDSTSQVTLAVAEDNLDQDFAYFVPSSIGNYVWDDSNGNGIQDGGESGHQGITVHLLDSSGNPVDDPMHPGTPYIVQTGGAGEYLFENLIPGTYQVQFDLPAGNSFTSRDSGGDDAVDSDPDLSSGRVTVVLGAGESNLTIDAGLVGPAINIEKSTNSVDADTPPGVTLAVGDAVTWSYVVTNTGNVALTNVTVTDDRIGTVTCPQTTLAAGESMTCTATGTATAGQYGNIGSVIGTPPSGAAVLDSDPSHYIATSPTPTIDIEKSTNGQDADTGTGPVISIGDPVTWSYVVTNTGNVELTDVAVTDDRIGVISCPQTILAVGASMSCTATGTATAGQYENTGSVIGTPSGGGDPMTDTDPSHYFGSTPGSDFAAVDIEKATNGQDADSTPGPFVEIGYIVNWTYVVINTGNVDLTNVTVTDNLVSDTDIHCPDDGNTDNRITSLPVGASAICIATGTTTAGQYENTGSVVGTPPIGPDVTDTDPSHYYGSNGSIEIEKATNKEDADTEPGPTIKLEEDVFWTYVITNTGPFTLANVTVTDDQGVTVSCPKDILAAGESMTCTGQGVAVEGQYENIGTVNATTPKNEQVNDDDPSHYFGKTFNWSMFVPIFTAQRCPPVPDYCYMVADGDNKKSSNSPLFKYTFETDALELLNRLGVHNVEAIILSLDGKTLYGTDKGVLGIIDLTEGKADSFTAINSSGAGAGLGELGTVIIKDIDGLSFDPTTGILYGSNRHGDGIAGELDLLVQLDPDTGRLIKNAFGAGVDYLVINTASVGASDVDDIAIDYDGTLYGVAGNSGGGGGDHLIIINKKTGGVTDHGPLNQQGQSVQDMEGLTLHDKNTLYGTTGLEFTSEGTANTLYKIEKQTGETKAITRLDKNFNGYVPTDFEAISCFPICK